MALYRRLLEFLKPYWVKLVIAMACMSVVSATSALYAYVVKNVIDDIFVKKDVAMLYLIPLGVILLFFVNGLFYYLQAYFMGYVGQRVITNIRNLIFANLQKQPLSFFDKTPTGQSISRIMNDVTLIQSTVSDSVTAILIDRIQHHRPYRRCLLPGLEAGDNFVYCASFCDIPYRVIRQKIEKGGNQYTEIGSPSHELSP